MFVTPVKKGSCCGPKGPSFCLVKRVPFYSVLSGVVGNAVPETGHEQTVLERLCSYTLNPLGRLQSGAHLAFAPHVLLSQKAGPPVAASQARRPLFYCLVASSSPSLSPSLSPLARRRTYPTDREPQFSPSRFKEYRSHTGQAADSRL